MQTEAETTPLTVLVAVGEPAARSRICAALAARGFAVPVDAGDAAAAVAAAADARPDVCLVDADLPGQGLAAVARIAAQLPAATIVVLAAEGGPEQMIAALEHGASGYLLGELGDDELARALHAAHAGVPALPRALVPHLIDHVRRGARRVLALPGGAVVLTPREWEIAELVRAGLPTGRIAARLELSPVTVRRHVSSLLRKCGAASRGELAETLKLHMR